MNWMFSSLHTYFFFQFSFTSFGFGPKVSLLGIRPETATILLSTMFLPRFIMLLVIGFGSSFDGWLLGLQYIKICFRESSTVGLMQPSMHSVIGPTNNKTAAWRLLFRDLDNLLTNTFWITEFSTKIVVRALFLLVLPRSTSESITISFTCSFL